MHIPPGSLLHWLYPRERLREPGEKKEKERSTGRE